MNVFNEIDWICGQNGLSLREPKELMKIMRSGEKGYIVQYCVLTKK